MTTRLTDIIDTVVFNDLPAVDSPEKTVFVDSGVVRVDPLISRLANSPGKTAELPFWKDLDATVETNYSNDNPATIATPQKAEQGEQIARKAFVNQGWKVSDLASEIAMGTRAMEHIRKKTDKYFARQFQRRLIAATNGILADNVANDSGDMVIDVASESIAGQTSSTLFNLNSFIDAAHTSGDSAENYQTIVVHSNVMAQMRKNNDVVDIPDSTGSFMIPTYQGLRVIVDDGMTVTAGATDGFKYTSILFADGAFGFGTGDPEVPVAVEREEAQGNGGGMETLWVRNTWLLHPFGFQQTGTPAGESFTQAELAAATSWDRVIERKNVPIAFLITN